MEKANEKNNIITWFEIPVGNSERAKNFYETILDIKMLTLQTDETNDEMTIFPSDPHVIQPNAGKLTGVLLKNKGSKPSQSGVTIYINGSPFIQKVVDKIEPAGEKVIVPKTKMRTGYYSAFIDTEGNKIALLAGK